LGVNTDIIANGNPESSVGPGFNPGDPNMLDTSDFDEIPEARALPWVAPSPWSGYPAEWGSPGWAANGNASTSAGAMSRVVDAAWAAIDLNSSVLASMPVYRLRRGVVVSSPLWMVNPDPTIYSSWQEFAKQLFWDYHLGEAFVLPMATSAAGLPTSFRVIPPWLISVEMRGGRRDYRLGSTDVTDEILHIRYASTTDNARGVGPLDVAGARQVAVRLLQRYADTLAETGGTPMYWLGLQRTISESEGRDLLDRWIESRAKYAGQPAIVSGGATLNQTKSMNAEDVALLELTHFNEARIAILLGVPPFLLGLASGGGGSITYSNVESLFDFHDRSSLRPKANAVMAALGQWALPASEAVELNRDDYTRPGLVDRARAYEIMINSGVLKPEEARAMERLYGTGAATQLSGGFD
jgi:HK97 family phage portal protein